MYIKIRLVLNKINRIFKLKFGKNSDTTTETHSVITQIGGENNVQHVRAGGKITLIGSKNNVQNVVAGGDLVVISTQIGGKGNIQIIE